jgi:glycosyltransferase involved in cell wall biosynthesis
VYPRGHVLFNESFLGSAELLHVLSGCDIYVNAYTERQQAVSGTLSMALGAGAALVSTPYPHALELLRGGLGVFVPFEDHHALAAAILGLLADPGRLADMKRRSLLLAKQLSWAKVAQSHLDLIRTVSNE